MGRYNIYIILFASILLLSQCRLNDKKEWEAEYLTPIAYGELYLTDLLPDSNVKLGNNDALILVSEQQLQDINIGDLLKVPDTTIEKSVSLKTIQLGSRELNHKITLGEVAKNAGFAGQYIIFNHGKRRPIPAFSNLSSGDVNINAESFFESATFIDGKLRLEIKNGFPVALTDVHFRISNQSDGAIVVEDNISSLPPNSTFSSVYSLAGKTVEGKMVARIISMSSPGSGTDSVLIDTSNALHIRMVAYDMKVQSAKAIFPAQNLVDDRVNIGYYMGGAEIVFMKIRTGRIDIKTTHTVQDSLFMFYSIPDAKLNGVPLSVNRTIPPAPPGDSSSITESYSVDNYDVDLTGKNKDTVNTFFNILTLRIDSSGKLQYLSLDDKIYLKYGLYSVVPQYARGYLGQMIQKVGPETVEFSSFGKILNGEIELDELNVLLDVENGIGAPARVKIISLKSINTKSGKSRQLAGSILSQDINIQAATDNPLTPKTTSISLNSTNSNIQDLISILPDRFEYEMELAVNPDGIKDYNQFIYYDSKVNANLNIEIPLDLSMKGLVLQDTVDLNIGFRGSENIQDGTLHIYAENSYPMDADIQLYILDNNNQVIDSIFITNENRIAAGNINTSNGKVEQPSITRLNQFISSSKWDMLTQNNKLIMRATLNTVPTNSTLKLYSSYKLMLKLSSNVKYRNKL